MLDADFDEYPAGKRSNPRLDDAARAGWLYYVAGNTQDQIAAKLGISRQTAQRLVSLAVSEGLIKVRVDHPIANCLELAAKLRSRFALDLVEVVPSDPDLVVDHDRHRGGRGRRDREAAALGRRRSSWRSAPAAR